MSIKNGFGNITELLTSSATVGRPTNRNLVIQLSSKQEKRITDIVAGYNLDPLTPATTFLKGGRLLVVGAKYDDYETIINPNSPDLPDSLSSSTVYLDVQFAQKYPLNNMIPQYSYHSSKGIHVAKGTDASIILTFAQTDDQAYPASNLVIGYLNVDGFSGGSDAPFKNIR